MPDTQSEQDYYEYTDRGKRFAVGKVRGGWEAYEIANRSRYCNVTTRVGAMLLMRGLLAKLGGG